MFGLFTAAGVLATLLLLFFFLPSWMQLWPMKPHSVLDGDAPKAEDLALPASWRRFLGGVLRHNYLVFAALGGLMVFCGFGLTKLNTSIKLTKLFSEDAEIIHNYAWLEQKLGPLIPMEIVVRIDNSKCQMSMLERMQLLSRVQERLLGINGIGNTMSAVTFAVPLEIKRAGPFVSKKMMGSILNKKLEDHRDEYLESGFLSVEGDMEMWRISARVGALNDIDYGEFIKAIKKEVDPVIAEQRAELAKKASRAAGTHDSPKDNQEDPVAGRSGRRRCDTFVGAKGPGSSPHGQRGFRKAESNRRHARHHSRLHRAGARGLQSSTGHA